MFFQQMHPTWQAWLAEYEPALQELEAKTSSSLPSAELVMRAFSQDPKAIRVVILGQDPYPNPGVATGFAFAIETGTKKPRSLINIEKELADDLNTVLPASFDLADWAKRGVLLLNTTLTTLPNQPGSHSKLGWEKFTKAALVKLASEQQVIVLAWGNPARELASELPRAVVIESAHPSPLSASRGFFGSKPFSRANSALEILGLEPITWL
ncbi:MAG: Uracil-DNA glycosylase [Actinomycetota bacterium]|jgi:uracil-DNA glycosylase